MAEDAIEPNECQSLNPVHASSGRVAFMGIDMAFLIVNGNEMFTLNEILEKIFPNTPRTTVCTRLEKMRAIRHACTKQEIRTLKALGGAKPCAINCTMVARRHVVEYYEKFKLQNKAKDTSSDSPGLKKSQSQRDIPTASTISQGSNPNSAAEILEGVREVPAEDLKCRSDEGGYNVNQQHTSRDSKAANETKTNEPEVGNGSSQNVHADVPKQQLQPTSVPNSVSWNSAAGKLSKAEGRPSEVGQTVDNCDHKQARNLSVNKKPGKPFVRKRKRRTNLEILESYNREIAQSLKQQRKTKSKGKAKGNKEVSIKKIRAHVNPSKSNGPNPKSIKRLLTHQPLSLKLEDVSDDEGRLVKGFLDQNNNDVQPQSSTFLLKRSLNNGWRVANSISTMNSATLLQATVQKASTNLSPTGKLSPTQSSQTITSSENKSNGSTGSCSSMTIKMKKKGRPFKVRKTEAIETVTADLQCDVNAIKKETVNLKSICNTGDGSALSGGENAKTAEPGGLLNTDTSPSKLVPKIIKRPSPASEEGRRRKRRQRVHLNTFRLVETLPYPSLLKVKDGDLCPEYTMTYSSKSDPGCCHPLWRWRLGKPVLPPKQTRMSSSPVRQLSGENCEEDCPVSIKNDDISSKNALQA